MKRSGSLKRALFLAPRAEDGTPKWPSLAPGGPLQRHQEMPRGTGLRPGTLKVIERDGAPVLTRPEWQQRSKPIKPVSDKRRRENRERAAMADRLWPDRRDGTVMCARPGCPRRAVDLHERLSRARRGSITDPENTVPLCRECHDEITFRPESELAWAYAAGLLVHSWDRTPGGAA